MKEVVHNMRSGCAVSSSVVSNSSEINAACYSSSKRPQEIESMRDGVNNLHSDSVYSIYLHFNPSSQSDDYIIPRVNIGTIT